MMCLPLGVHFSLTTYSSGWALLAKIVKKKITSLSILIVWIISLAGDNQFSFFTEKSSLRTGSNGDFFKIVYRR